jgi:hypothetical protein
MSEHSERPIEQTPQQHKILRQVLEVSGCDAEASHSTQSALRDTYYQRLLPLIETLCSQASAPDQIHRIDRLEIELHAKTAAAFDSVLPKPFEVAFREKLAAAMDDAPQIDADLELFDYFIRTGNLPWWANSYASTQLDTSLERLIQTNPQALRQLLQRVAEPIYMRRRLVRAYPDRLLDNLLSVLAPTMTGGVSVTARQTTTGIGSAWLALLDSVSRAQGHAKLTTRHLWWEEILREAAGAERTPAPAAAVFYQAILKRVAPRLGFDYTALISDLHHALNNAALPMPAWVCEIAETLWQTLKPEIRQVHVVSQLHDIREAKTSNAIIDAVRSDLTRLLVRLEHTPAVDSELWTQLRGVIERLPASLKAQALVVFNAVKVNAAKPNIENAEPNLKPPANASIEVSPASKDGLITELRSALESLDPTPITEPDLQTSATAPQPKKADPAGDKLRSDLRRLLARLEHDPAVDSELWTQLRGVIERLPASLKGTALGAFDLARGIAQKQPHNITTDKTEPTDHGNHASTKDRLIALLRSTVHQLPSLATIRPKTINQQETTNKQEIPINSSFSETDAIYVGNGGLVILWPFLQPFFERLGLTHNKQFKDTSSAQRAVGLLQYLASGDESPLEFLLPLNKMLCGLAPESVFDFGVEISLEEKQECDDLLAAVIQQAPILKSMSSAGFRVSFLLRQGLLSTRDGQWLLRVERETHDIVLDRFPWGVSIIRLPWMTAIMQVEW